MTNFLILSAEKNPRLQNARRQKSARQKTRTVEDAHLQKR